MCPACAKPLLQLVALRVEGWVDLLFGLRRRFESRRLPATDGSGLQSFKTLRGLDKCNVPPEV